MSYFARLNYLLDAFRKYTHTHIHTRTHIHTYRADWEPATTSGKCMAGVPGVFWRSPVVLWGPTTHNPTLI